MRAIGIALALLASCRPQPTPQEQEAAIDEYIQTYLASDGEAECTKDPAAVRKRDLAEMKVVSAAEDPVLGLKVREALAKKRVELVRREEELTSERNSILVAGRAHSDSDTKRLGEIAAQLREVEFMKNSLAVLSSRIRG